MAIHNPIVSIIVPCFNHGEYLSEALESVFNQTFTEWECIIVDDGSSDNTKDVAMSYKNMDFRFKYIYQKNSGLASARNTGINEASGVYILPLDADDKISTDYLKEGVHILDNDPEIKIVYADAQKFGESHGKWELNEYKFKDFLLENSIFCTAFFRKADYEKTDGYNTNMKYGLEDWDFWITLLEKGGKVHKILSVHFHYRIRPNSMVYSIDRKKEEFLKTQIFLNHVDVFIAEYGDPISAYKENILLKKQLNKIKSSIPYRLVKYVKTFLFG